VQARQECPVFQAATALQYHGGSVAGKQPALKAAHRAGAETLSEADFGEEEDDGAGIASLDVNADKIAEQIKARKKGQVKVFRNVVDDPHQKVADKQGYGKLYSAFGGGHEGLAACKAGTSFSPFFRCIVPYRQFGFARVDLLLY